MSAPGLRSIGQIAAQMVAVTDRRDLPVGDCTVTVLIAEGSAQMIWHRGGPGLIAGQAFFNDFLSPGMGDQLRAVADAVDAAVARNSHPEGAVK